MLSVVTLMPKTSVQHNALDVYKRQQKGVPPQFISDMVQEYINSGLMLQSYMVVKDGCVISEGWFKPYSSEYRHMMFSITKGFTSLATGMAIDEGPVSYTHLAACSGVITPHILLKVFILKGIL